MNAVDTNILIYACDQRDRLKQKRAQDVLSHLVDGVILWQVACEFIAASRRLASVGFTPDAAWAQLADLLQAFPLILPNAGVLQHARTLHIDQQIAYWDAMVPESLACIPRTCRLRRFLACSSSIHSSSEAN